MEQVVARGGACGGDGAGVGVEEEENGVGGGSDLGVQGEGEGRGGGGEGDGGVVLFAGGAGCGDGGSGLAKASVCSVLLKILERASECLQCRTAGCRIILESDSGPDLLTLTSPSR